MLAATGPQARCAHMAFSPFSPSNQEGLKLFQRFETNKVSVVQSSRNIYCDFHFIEPRLVITQLSGKGERTICSVESQRLFCAAETLIAVEIGR